MWPERVSPSGQMKRGLSTAEKTETYHYRTLHERGITCLGDYIAAWTDILHMCPVCLHDWWAAPANMLHPTNTLSQCRKCGIKASADKRRKTATEYMAELANIDTGVQVYNANDYAGINTPIRHICPCGNDEWMVSPYHVLDGSMCSQCMNQRSSQKQTKAHEDYVAELAAVGSGVTVLAPYINNKTAIRHRCPCGNEQWMAMPGNVLRGAMCNRCRAKKFGILRQKSHEEYVAEVAEVNPGVSVLEAYDKARKHIWHRCVCGRPWLAKPDYVLSGRHCQYCAPKGSKNNATYIWRFIDESLYKVGCTSQDLGEERIHWVAKKWKTTAVDCLLVPVVQATALEVQVKNRYGHLRPFMNSDRGGREEIYELSPEQAGWIYNLLRAAEITPESLQQLPAQIQKADAFRLVDDT